MPRRECVHVENRIDRSEIKFENGKNIILGRCRNKNRLGYAGTHEAPLWSDVRFHAFYQGNELSGIYSDGNSSNVCV